jgi:hypothetical protein
MGGAVYADVESGGSVVVSGKKEGSEASFIGCSASIGGAIAISFSDDVNNDDVLVLSGIIYIGDYCHFFLLLLFINRFSII